MKISIGILGAAVLALLAGDAFAQDRAQRLRERDGNGDGVLSREEYVSTGGHPGNFAALDVNNDGFLTHAEFVDRNASPSAPSVQAGPPVAAVPQGDDRLSKDVLVKDPYFGAYDRNRDDVLTKAEWPSTPAEFSRYDRDNDGRITAYEWANPLDADTLRGRFALMDRNNDGRLTSREWRDMPESFRSADRNRDGRITLAEFRALPSVQQAQRELREGRRADRREERLDDRQFARLDRNNDRVITRNEWSGNVGVFNEADRNRDGRVTEAEFRDRPFGDHDDPDSQAMDRRFATLDRNNDGVLSRFEWGGDANSFNQADRNRDGVVTVSEYDAVMRTSAGRWSFDELDVNRDGFITIHEWRGDPEVFRALDRSRDGVLNRFELQQGGW